MYKLMYDIFTDNLVKKIQFIDYKQCAQFNDMQI